jgi:hydroxymethylpyrimidine pyrophosphatase-like HAD family hydrolase
MAQKNCPVGPLVPTCLHMPSIKLISTDFDGTLIGFSADGKCSPKFAEAIVEHRDRGGLWAINTGRSLSHAVDGILRFESPVAPDFLLTNEREVFRWDDGWAAYGEWNDRCREQHEELFTTAMELFSEVEKMAKRQSGIQMIYEEDRPVGLVTESELLMDTFVQDIDQAALNHLDFGYQRNTVYLRFCHRDYHKGSALAELCRLEGVPVDQVFAAGDHYNDIPMLDSRYAGMVACPANAIDPVKEKVTLSQGYVSPKNWADGVADALSYYAKREEAETNTVLT